MPITDKQREKLEAMLTRGARRKVDREECVKMYLSGTPVTEIAEHFGVKVASIYGNLQAARDGK